MNDTATPHLDAQWREAFILELRVLDVPGDAIGAALADVESRCAAGEQSAFEAFGDPVAYARTLPVPRGPLTRRSAAPVMWRAIGGTAGMLVGLKGFAAYLGTGIVLLTIGDLAALALVLVMLGVLWLFADRLLAAVAHGRRSVAAIVGGLATGAVIAAVVALQVYLSTVLWLVPAGLLFGLGLGLLIVVTLTGLANASTDPIVGPLDGVRSQRSGLLWARVGACTYLIAAVLLGILIWASRAF